MTVKSLQSCAFLLSLILLTSSSALVPALASEPNPPLKVTLLHTNDLHSHFRPDRSQLQLGGIGRIKTAVDRLRKENPNTLLVDAGDWSEGNIYYTLGAGVETLTMMDKVGYDVAVVGNHDFLNGPDVLTEVIGSANPKMSLVATNISLENYKKAEELRKWVLPYVIKEVGGHKIAFIGLTTYELIYDRFFSPVKITEPFFATQSLAAKLKKENQVDAVVVLSHNSIFANKWILKAAPAVDLIIGAHDHVKIDKPIEVTRWGAKPGWIVETGLWGRYLGKVEIELSEKNISLKTYNLIQMDLTVPEDPEISARISKLEVRLEEKYGPIFSSLIGRNDLELYHSGEENLIGNLVTDAYVRETGADFALESNTAIYGELHPGNVRPVDIFNVYPGIFNPTTNKTWTLKKIPIQGSAIQKILNLLYASQKLRSYGCPSVSGISFTIDPLFLHSLKIKQEATTPPDLQSPLDVNEMKHIMGLPIVKDIQIHGIPLDPNKTYTLVTGGMLVAGFELINSVISLVPLEGLIDTDVEVWKAIANHFQKASPIRSESVKIGDRATPKGPELGVYESDVTWTTLEKLNDGVKGRIRVQIKNYGKSPSVAGTAERGPRLQILSNMNGIDESNPVYQTLLDGIAIPAIAPNQSWTFEGEVTLSAAKTPSALFYPVTVNLNDARGNLGPTNKRVVRFFQ